MPRASDRATSFWIALNLFDLRAETVEIIRLHCSLSDNFSQGLPLNFSVKFVDTRMVRFQLSSSLQFQNQINQPLNNPRENCLL